MSIDDRVSLRAQKEALILGLATTLTIGASIIVCQSPLKGAAFGLALPVLALIVASPGARLFVVVAGALVVFQSDSPSGKFGYVALAVLCCGLSLIRLARSRDPLVRCFRPLIPASALLLTMIGLSGLVSIGSGITGDLWAREVLSYILLATLPTVGLDTGRTILPRHLDRYMAALGLLCAIGFAVDWLDRRGVSGLEFGRFILATSVLPALCFTYALTRADYGRRAFGWLTVASLIFAILLVTGTRTNFVLAVGLVGVVGLRRGSGIHPVRLLIYMVGMVATLASLVPFLARSLISDPAFFQGRVAQALAVVQGEASSDQSYLARQHSYELAQAAWEQHPWLGAGPGGIAGSDAPMLILAKFGLLGTGALVLFGAALVLGVARTRGLAGPQPIHAAARGWLLILVVLTPFGPWTEDKGISLAVALLMAAVVSQCSASGQPSVDASKTSRTSEPADQVAVVHGAGRR